MQTHMNKKLDTDILLYNGTNNIRLVFILFARERDYARAFVAFF